MQDRAQPIEVHDSAPPLNFRPADCPLLRKLRDQRADHKLGILLPWVGEIEIEIRDYFSRVVCAVFKQTLDYGGA